jgi:hypothetical protein
LAHLEENIEANDLVIEPSIMSALDQLINEHTVAGARYSDKAQATVTTEEFSAKQ